MRSAARGNARPLPPHARRVAALAAIAAACTLVVAACGGGALDNPPTVSNAATSANGQKLSFAYFQRCVMPVLRANLSVNINGVTSVNSCSAGGCHDNTTGTGGALRLVGSASDVDLATAAATSSLVRTTDMYRNFYSAQGETVIGDPQASRLLVKPLVQGVLHGGGLIFASASDPNAKVLSYWISHPMPAGQDEFSDAAAALFNPADVHAGQCNTG